jgi:ABC-type polysaccharide/polyol phosphate transport system ATPase subunit
MAKAIKAENISKAYQLGNFGTGTISRDLERFWARFRGKEDPFLKVGEANDRTRKGSSDIVWSLKDINFDIDQGDAVGIIGSNGAGKSTLLKILSRVTSPTTGSVKVKGRIASLLEVGTGFHPELSGRENIYLNGAILGMRKAEIKRKFDEIVEFSGVERYIDTPVKRYSSGMYVRLAFAVAAHLESEILIVDEVLAVGDAEFQKKCLGKMSDVTKGEGRTVLFVSHNLSSILQLCSNGILLNNGMISKAGPIKSVTDSWHSDYYQDKPKEQRPPKYWFSYRLNKYLEPKAMKCVDGLISVSEGYIATLRERYAHICDIPSSVIPFGVHEKDFAIAQNNEPNFEPLLTAGKTNIVYIGRGGADLHTALKPVFETLKQGLVTNEKLFRELHFYFIGTSYAAAGKGQPTITPLAKTMGVKDHVTEITDRISFYHTLLTLQRADALFIPGSDDPQYTASKIYPYLFTGKPMLAIFHQNSSAVNVINECTDNASLIKFSDDNKEEKLYQLLTKWANGDLPALELTESIAKYSAENMALQQTELFNKIIRRP